MVIFDQLRISDDGKQLLIDVHVNKAAMYQNKYLESITILTSDQVSEVTPDLVVNDNFIYKTEFEGDLKEAHLVIGASDLYGRREELEGSRYVDVRSFPECEISNTLFFVYVKVREDGNFVESIPPCGLDELTTLGVTFDENILHQKVMSYTKDLIKDCGVHQDFIDFILLWSVFKSAIETEHYIPAIKFFKMMFDNDCKDLNVKRCKCHG